MHKVVKTSTLASIDKPTILLYLILVFMGWLNIYAAVYSEEHSSILDIGVQYGKQMIWISAALILGITLLIVESKIYPVFSIGVYSIVMLFLIAVLIFGREVNGAKSWFELGSFRLQPAEFAKVATCLMLSKYLSLYNLKLGKPRTIITLIFIIGMPMALIALQPDMGSAIVYGSLLLVLFRQGMPGLILLLIVYVVLNLAFSLLWGSYYVSIGVLIIGILSFLFYEKSIKATGIAIGMYIAAFASTYAASKLLHVKISMFFLTSIPFLLIGLPALILAYRRKLYKSFVIYGITFLSLMFSYSVNYIIYNVLSKHQQDRIEVMFGMKSDPLGVEYNLIQSKIAIGSGEMYGKGFLKGTQTKLNYVPEQSTDFIFCTVGEEWGFIGTTLLIALYIALLLRLVFLAERQRSIYSKIYGYCVASILFIHVFINIAMTIGVFPTVGIPLPFFSYGGSSLWGFTILLFIFIRLDASRDSLIQ